MRSLRLTTTVDGWRVESCAKNKMAMLCVTEPGKSTRVHWLIPFVVCEVRRGVVVDGKVERALRVLSHRHTATEYMHMPS